MLHYDHSLPSPLQSQTLGCLSLIVFGHGVYILPKGDLFSLGPSQVSTPNVHTVSTGQRTPRSQLTSSSSLPTSNTGIITK